MFPQIHVRRLDFTNMSTVCGLCSGNYQKSRTGLSFTNSVLIQMNAFVLLLFEQVGFGRLSIGIRGWRRRRRRLGAFPQDHISTRFVRGMPMASPVPESCMYSTQLFLVGPSRGPLERGRVFVAWVSIGKIPGKQTDSGKHTCSVSYFSRATCGPCFGKAAQQSELVAIPPELADACRQFVAGFVQIRRNFAQVSANLGGHRGAAQNFGQIRCPQSSLFGRNGCRRRLMRRCLVPHGSGSRAL